MVTETNNKRMGDDTERLLRDWQRELDEARLATAVAEAAARNDRSLARESLEKAQDLTAEVFRVRDQLKMARLDADEAYSRVLDLEMEVRQEQARLAELHVHHERLGEHLRQALASRPWLMFRGVIERMRGLQEPASPAAGAGTPGGRTRRAPGPSGED